MTTPPAIQKIRARIEQLSGSLRGAYNLAQQNRNNQPLLDRCVVEVVRLERLIRRAERSLNLLFTEQDIQKAQKLAAAAIPPFVSTPVPIAEPALKI